MPAEIKILSAGAVKPGLTKVIEAFQKKTGQKINISFATAPAIVLRIGSAKSFDNVIAPPQVLDELANVGKLSRTEQIAIGRIGVGIMVRAGAPLPQIATVDDFKRCLLTAESLIYNQASTGIYLDALFDRLGGDLKAKSKRYADFAAVLEHVSKGSGREIGFGATTVIIENKTNGIQFAGPLPAEIQNYTTYAAVAVPRGTDESAQAFTRHLASPPARDIFAAAGIT